MQFFLVMNNGKLFFLYFLFSQVEKLLNSLFSLSHSRSLSCPRLFLMRIIDIPYLNITGPDREFVNATQEKPDIVFGNLLTDNTHSMNPHSNMLFL